MANIGTMKDIYTAAKFVGIPGDAITRFVGTLEATGYEIKFKDSPPDVALPSGLLEWLWNREVDIAFEIEDFGDLHGAFKAMFGHEPRRMPPDEPVPPSNSARQPEGK